MTANSLKSAALASNSLRIGLLPSQRLSRVNLTAEMQLLKPFRDILKRLPSPKARWSDREQ